MVYKTLFHQVITCLLLSGMLVTNGCHTVLQDTDDSDDTSIWYVQQNQLSNQKIEAGTRAEPFHSLETAEQISKPGDTIRILPSPVSSNPLVGGIILKEGQILEGLSENNRRAQITNTQVNHHEGDAVKLANNSIVRNLHIVQSAGHAIVGRNVHGIAVENNWIQGGNGSDLTSVTTGATASLGVLEFPKGIISLFHSSNDSLDSENRIINNTISGTASNNAKLFRLNGPGISIHTRGPTESTLYASNNKISDLGAGFQRSGMLIDTQDNSQLSLTIEDTTVSNAFSSSDGIILIAQNDSSISGAIRRYHYKGSSSPSGVGNNGLEVVTYSGGNWLKPVMEEGDWHSANTRLILEHSTIEGADGFGIAFFNLFGKPSKKTVLDFGAGELGGEGSNRIFNNGKLLPYEMDAYLVHQDINMSNNWWGTTQTGESKTQILNDEAALKEKFVLVCPGTPEQIEKLTEHTGVAAWSTFCQAFSDNVCRNDSTPGPCCDRNSDPNRCMESANDSSFLSSPALPISP